MYHDAKYMAGPQLDFVLNNYSWCCNFWGVNAAHDVGRKWHLAKTESWYSGFHNHQHFLVSQEQLISAATTPSKAWTVALRPANATPWSPDFYVRFSKRRVCDPAPRKKPRLENQSPIQPLSPLIFISDSSSDHDEK